MTDSIWYFLTFVTALLLAMRFVKKDGWYNRGLVRKFSNLFPAFLVLSIIRGMIVVLFQIPTESMVPTLNVGDNILVTRYSYGVKLPGTDIFIWPQKVPERGDVIVFQYPVQPDVPYVKRVIGLPGDVINYKNKQLIINGIPLATTDEPLTEKGNVVSFEERIKDRLYTIHNYTDSEDRNNEWIVPPDHLFVLGDNRDGSLDSRHWGYVSYRFLIGKVDRVFMNFSGGNLSFAANRDIE